MQSPPCLKGASLLALQELADLGLNLFASCEVGGLSATVKELLLREKIRPENYSMFGVFAHGGRRLWDNLSKTVRVENDPFDSFSIKAVERFLQRLAPSADTLLLYPSSRFVIPLQQIGRQLNLARPSPLGLDLNRDYGPWFAYRVAFLTTAPLPVRIPAAFKSPCAACTEKPCLTSCPPRATGYPFRMRECAEHRRAPDSSCADRCLARIACPYAEEHRYDREQIRYHMLQLSRLKTPLGIT